MCLQYGCLFPSRFRRRRECIGGCGISAERLPVADAPAVEQVLEQQVLEQRVAPDAAL